MHFQDLPKEAKHSKHTSHTALHKIHIKQSKHSLSQVIRFSSTQSILCKRCCNQKKAFYTQGSRSIRNPQELASTVSSYGLRVANNQKLMVRSISKAVQAKMLLSAEPGITAKESKYTHTQSSEQGECSQLQHTTHQRTHDASN